MFALKVSSAKHTVLAVRLEQFRAFFSGELKELYDCLLCLMEKDNHVSHLENQP